MSSLNFLSGFEPTTDYFSQLSNPDTNNPSTKTNLKAQWYQQKIDETIPISLKENWWIILYRLLKKSVYSKYLNFVTDSVFVIIWFCIELLIINFLWRFSHSFVCLEVFFLVDFFWTFLMSFFFVTLNKQIVSIFECSEIFE